MGSKFFINRPSLSIYVLLKSGQPDPIQWNTEGKQAEEVLEEILLSKAPALEHLNYKLSSFLFMNIKEMLYRRFNSKTAIIVDLQDIIVSN